VITGVAFVGTKTAVVKLLKGTYRHSCDPRSSTAKGTFRVV
jgi:hypothetical protein